MNIKLVKVYHFTGKNNILLYYYLKSTTYTAPQTKQQRPTNIYYGSLNKNWKIPKSNPN